MDFFVLKTFGDKAGKVFLQTFNVTKLLKSYYTENGTVIPGNARKQVGIDCVAPSDTILSKFRKARTF